MRYVSLFVACLFAAIGAFRKTEAIQIRFHPNCINRDSGIEISEARIVCNRRSTSGRFYLFLALVFKLNSNVNSFISLNILNFY